MLYAHVPAQVARSSPRGDPSWTGLAPLLHIGELLGLPDTPPGRSSSRGARIWETYLFALLFSGVLEVQRLRELFGFIEITSFPSDSAGTVSEVTPQVLRSALESAKVYLATSLAEPHGKQK